MAVAEDITLSRAAKGDLASLGERAAGWLFGELQGLPEMSEEECPELPGPQTEPPRRRARIGRYVAVFFVRPNHEGTEIAVIEYIRHRDAFDPWLANLQREAEAEEARLKEEEEEEEGDA